MLPSFGTQNIYGPKKVILFAFSILIYISSSMFFTERLFKSNNFMAKIYRDYFCFLLLRMNFAFLQKTKGACKYYISRFCQMTKFPDMAELPHMAAIFKMN